MFSGIHDAEVVAYSFDSRTAELVISLAPGHGSATGDFQLVFRGVVAHQFAYPQLPSIVLALTEMSAAALIAREWANLAEGHRQCGWPGPWAASTEAATAFCISSGLKGFELEQSYGMSGWILARSVEQIGTP